MSLPLLLTKYCCLAGLSSISVVPLVYSADSLSLGGGIGNKREFDHHRSEESLELKQISHQTLDILSEKRIDDPKSGQINFLEFISNLYKLLSESSLIEKIEVLSPLGKFPIRGFNLDISVTEKDAWLSSDGSKVDSSEKAYWISLGNVNSVSKKEIVKKMFAYFFDPEWMRDSEQNLSKEFIGADYSFNLESKELVFLRKYRGKYHYLKLKFNVDISNLINQDLINEISLLR